MEKTLQVLNVMERLPLLREQIADHDFDGTIISPTFNLAH
jgi:hypothetical protein